MYFIKLGEGYINLDNVTAIVPEAEGVGYVVHFVGQTHSRSICAMDMADIRGEFEKIKMLQDLDKIVLKTDDKKKDNKETECVGCVWNIRGADGHYECTSHHLCNVKLRLKK